MTPYLRGHIREDGMVLIRRSPERWASPEAFEKEAKASARYKANKQAKRPAEDRRHRLPRTAAVAQVRHHLARGRDVSYIITALGLRQSEVLELIELAKSSPAPKPRKTHTLRPQTGADAEGASPLPEC